MNWTHAFNPEPLYLEIRSRSLRVLHGEQSLVIPLERNGSGRLTADCREKVSLGLRGFLKRKSWQPRVRAFCAIEARGVSLRRLSLPGSGHDDLHRLVRLQIESQFPLPPEALAWGYSRVPQATATNGHNELVLAALKKEFLEDYAQVLASAGITPVFTLAALARSRVCSSATGSFAVLDIGRKQSELISFANGVPESVRVISWGGEDITNAIRESLGISQDEAEKLKFQWDEGPVPNGEVGRKTQMAIGTALESLAAAVRSAWSGQKLFLTGRGARYKEMSRQLDELLGSNVRCERVETGASHGATAALLGLKRAGENHTAPGPLVIRLKDSKTGEAAARPGETPWHKLASMRDEFREMAAQPKLRKYVRLAAILALCCLFLPLAQAIILKPFLKHKLASIKPEKERLAIIDRELAFLQFVKKTQPPYLDALTVVANSAPPGARFDTVSMNRHGDISLKGAMQNAQQVVDFRSKLIKSGFFSTVTVEEQAPTPDRQRLNVRIAAQWKAFGSRPVVKPDPLPAGYQPSGMPMGFPGMEGGPPMMFPGGEMPPGMPITRGGPAGPPVRSPAADAMRKAEKSKSGARSVTIGPDGQVIITESKPSSSDAKDSSEKDSKDAKDSKPKDSNE